MKYDRIQLSICSSAAAYATITKVDKILLASSKVVLLNYILKLKQGYDLFVGISLGLLLLPNKKLAKLIMWFRVEHHLDIYRGTCKFKTLRECVV